MALSAEQRRNHARLLCISAFGFDPECVGVGAYDEWLRKGSVQDMWWDDSISTAGILRAAWVSATIAEREACAKLCDAEARDCAIAIRARGNSTITVA